MSDLFAGDILHNLAVGCLALLTIVWLASRLAKASRQREANLRDRAEPDWSKFRDYVELANAAGGAHWLTPERFLEGPFRRFVQICSNPDDHPRARARMMEFGRGCFIGYLHSRAELGEDVAGIRARGRAMAAEWFGRPDVPDGDYMLEVFDGYSNHNYRGKPDPSCAHLVPKTSSDSIAQTVSPDRKIEGEVPESGKDSSENSGCNRYLGVEPNHWGSCYLNRQKAMRDWNLECALRKCGDAGFEYDPGNPYLTAKQKDLVDGWYQLPVIFQTTLTLALMLAGYAWWAAIPLAWLPSMMATAAIRSTNSVAVGWLGSTSQWILAIGCLLIGIYALWVGNWPMVVMAAVSLPGLPGLIGPASLLMSSSPDRWHPKYSYASRAFGVEFPFQSEATHLAVLATAPLTDEEEWYLTQRSSPAPV